ncbi:MAG: sodium-dependent transporter [Agathobacter sp.]|nr:sodium-dependent transporter [Agathobacter sp.]
MNREKFGSRLGFILVSAGCAIGLGNVWKFPYICGKYGGAAFILIYLLFLVLLGIPVMICEFAVGRGSKRSAATGFDQLAPKGTSWSKLKGIGILGCYLLMMFYTTVAGWMMYYCFRSLRGDFDGATPEQITNAFDTMRASAPTMLFWMILVCVIGFGVCYLGLNSGIEKISKFMMSALLLIMIVLAFHSLFMEGAGEGIKFYLVPDFQKMLDNGIGNVIFAALSQAFFTLSIGIGCMQIFGSYLDRSRSLAGEAINITLLDTFVALTAGLIIIPACFSFGIEPNSGPKLVFITLPNIFAQIPGGRIWNALFFLFLTFAALTTVIAVFESIVAFDMELLGWSRKKTVLVSAVLLIILSIPAVLGFNVLSGFQPLGANSNIMDLEDLLVTNTLLPLGSLGYVLFCTRKNGWGWDAFLEEANAGKGLHLPKSLKGYVSYVIPLIIIVVYLGGYYDTFHTQPLPVLLGWMTFAIVLLAFVFFCALRGKKKD